MPGFGYYSTMMHDVCTIKRIDAEGNLQALGPEIGGERRLEGLCSRYLKRDASSAFVEGPPAVPFPSIVRPWSSGSADDQRVWP
jgi:hypothetical protein